MATDIYSRVRQTAFELVGEGVWPTVVEVRSRLGSGSNTTINNTLKEWRQEFLARMAVSSKRPDWPAGLAEAFEQIWQQACDQADAQLSSVRQEATAAVEQAQHQAEALNQSLQLRSAELQSALHELELRAARQAELEGRLQSEEARRQQSDDSRRTLEQKLDQAQQAQATARAAAEQRQVELEQKAELKIQEAREEAAQREALAYERLEGLRLRLYQQAEEERQQMKQAQDKLAAELALARQDAGRVETAWRERLLERERENGGLNARLELQQQRSVELEQALQQQQLLQEQNAARLLALSSENGRLAASADARLEQKLAQLAAALQDASEPPTRLDADAIRQWLLRQLPPPSAN